MTTFGITIAGRLEIVLHAANAKPERAATTIDEATAAQNNFTAIVMPHQAARGRGGSLETPGGSLLVKQKVIVDLCGTEKEHRASLRFTTTSAPISPR